MQLERIAKAIGDAKGTVVDFKQDDHQQPLCRGAGPDNFGQLHPADPGFTSLRAQISLQPGHNTVLVRFYRWPLAALELGADAENKKLTIPLPSTTVTRNDSDYCYTAPACNNSRV